MLPRKPASIHIPAHAAPQRGDVYSAPTETPTLALLVAKTIDKPQPTKGAYLRGPWLKENCSADLKYFLLLISSAQDLKYVKKEVMKQTPRPTSSHLDTRLRCHHLHKVTWLSDFG